MPRLATLRSQKSHF